ncbi:hypothetical protein [Actinoplanes sp. GCM10030250]|uniref:hypothetical protein n=1 Tax=Actinoplanes sp. GCM10030250 TaxID=3273376 RepID=UPI00361F5D9B
MFRRDPVKPADQIVTAWEQRDEGAFLAALEKLPQAARRAKPDQVQAAVVRLLPVLAEISPGSGGHLAQLAGAMADLGTDVTVVAPILVRRAAGVLEQAAEFERAYRAEHGSVPSSGFEAVIPQVMERFTGDPALVEAYFTANQWVQPVIYLSQRKEFRAAVAAVPDRPRLLSAAGAAKDFVDAAGWLQGLLVVVDDEPLIVLHRATGRAFRVTISGIGDNFQLHTLLAGALVGDAGAGLAGERPSAVEIAAASDGDPEPANGIRGTFNLVDHTGEWIWNEGHPADIPALDGVRLVVIDPAPYDRTWNTGRLYPHMKPELTVAGELPADEAATWSGRVKPSQR